jgi:hypothetical protein
MLGYALSEERRKEILKRPKRDTSDIFSQFTIRKPKRVSRF